MYIISERGEQNKNIIKLPQHCRGGEPCKQVEHSLTHPFIPSYYQLLLLERALWCGQNTNDSNNGFPVLNAYYAGNERLFTCGHLILQIEADLIFPSLYTSLIEVQKLVQYHWVNEQRCCNKQTETKPAKTKQNYSKKKSQLVWLQNLTTLLITTPQGLITSRRSCRVEQ